MATHTVSAPPALETLADPYGCGDCQNGWRVGYSIEHGDPDFVWDACPCGVDRFEGADVDVDVIPPPDDEHDYTDWADWTDAA